MSSSFVAYIAYFEVRFDEMELLSSPFKILFVTISVLLFIGIVTLIIMLRIYPDNISRNPSSPELTVDHSQKPYMTDGLKTNSGEPIFKTLSNSGNDASAVAKNGNTTMKRITVGLITVNKNDQNLTLYNENSPNPAVTSSKSGNTSNDVSTEKNNKLP